MLSWHAIRYLLYGIIARRRGDVTSLGSQAWRLRAEGERALSSSSRVGCRRAFVVKTAALVVITPRARKVIIVSRSRRKVLRRRGRRDGAFTRTHWTPERLYKPLPLIEAWVVVLGWHTEPQRGRSLLLRRYKASSARSSLAFAVHELDYKCWQDWSLFAMRYLLDSTVGDTADRPCLIWFRVLL